MNELLLILWKELKIFTLCNKFFSFTNDFNNSGGRVMKFTASGHEVYMQFTASGYEVYIKFTASGHHSLLIEVRGI